MRPFMSPFLCPLTSCPVRSSSSAVSFCSVASEAVLWRYFVLCSPLLAFRAGSTTTKHYISSSTPRSHSSSSFAPPEPRGSRDRKSLLWLSVGLRRALAFFVPARAMTDQRYSLRLGALVRLSSQAFSLVVSWLVTCSCIFHQLLP